MTNQEIMDVCVDYEKTIRRYREALREIAEMYMPDWKVGMTHETTHLLDWEGFLKRKLKMGRHL